MCMIFVICVINQNMLSTSAFDVLDDKQIESWYDTKCVMAFKNSFNILCLRLFL